MATATTIIQSAMRKLGLIASGESAMPTELTDALECLNDLLAAWSIDQLNMAYSVKEEFSLVNGVGTYTVGPGADFDTAKPLRILTAFIRDASSYDYILDVKQILEYDYLAMKELYNRPTKLYYKYDHPNGTIYFDYRPTKIEVLHINSIKALTAFADLTSDVAIADELKSALVYNLAIEISPEFNAEPTAVVNTRAYKTLSLLKSMRLSEQLTPISLNLPCIGVGNYNIDSDNTL